MHIYILTFLINLIYSFHFLFLFILFVLWDIFLSCVLFSYFYLYIYYYLYFIIFLSFISRFLWWILYRPIVRFWTVDSISRRRRAYHADSLRQIARAIKIRAERRGSWRVCCRWKRSRHGKEWADRLSRVHLDVSLSLSLPPPLRRPRSSPIDERNCSTTVTS